VVIHPISQTVHQGYSTNFKCISSSENHVWLLNGSPILNSKHIIIHGNFLQIVNVTKSDQATVTCEVKIDGEHINASAKLYVKGESLDHNNNKVLVTVGSQLFGHVGTMGFLDERNIENCIKGLLVRGCGQELFRFCTCCYWIVVGVRITFRSDH